MIELPVISKEETKRRKPDWLRVKLPIGPEYAKVRKLVDEHKLHTICESGNCPNMGEVYVRQLACALLHTQAQWATLHEANLVCVF